MYGDLRLAPLLYDLNVLEPYFLKWLHPRLISIIEFHYLITVSAINSDVGFVTVRRIFIVVLCNNWTCNNWQYSFHDFHIDDIYNLKSISISYLLTWIYTGHNCHTLDLILDVVCSEATSNNKLREADKYDIKNMPSYIHNLYIKMHVHVFCSPCHIYKLKDSQS